MIFDTTALHASLPVVPSSEAIPRFFNFSAWQDDNPPSTLESPWYPSYVAGLRAVEQGMFEVALGRLNKVCDWIHR